ncbi:MAG: chemotaxis protein CheB [Ktedonobacterales bacterium]|nr:chemotaxis protein CheB [Ktedonobacterales bacterium]
MPRSDILVIGASAGGIEALTTLVRGLPADLPAAVFVVLHLSPHSPSMLPHILTRAGPLTATMARDGEAIQSGHIYVAPPDHHLLLERGIMRVARGPKENRCRPAVDPLFRTAARDYGPRVVGVVLSGALDDGTAGLLAIKHQGGIAIAQDPREALMPMMPTSAITYVKVDYVEPAERIGPLLARLARDPVNAEGAPPVPPEMDFEASVPQSELDAVDGVTPPGKLVPITCPECKGPFWETDEDDLVRFRCREGHAYTADSVLESQYEEVEQALWIALEALTESALMAERLAAQSRARHHDFIAKRFASRAEDSRARAATIRRVLESGAMLIPDESTTETWAEAPIERAGE